MKVIAMISRERAQKYPYCMDQNIFKEFWMCAKSFLLENNIKYHGWWHQTWRYGVPVIEFCSKPYVFLLTQRRWGKLIAETFDPKNDDPLAYARWAFAFPEGEEPTVKHHKNPLLYPPILTKKGMKQ